MLRPRTWSLRQHLFALAGAIALPLVAVTGYAIYNDSQQAVAEANATVRTLATIIAAQTGRGLAANKEALEVLARRPRMRAVDEKHCDPVLADFRELFPRFANLTTIDLSGRAVCSAVAQPGGKPVNVSATEWFKRSMAEKRFLAGRPFLGPITGKWVSVLTSPIYDADGALKGFMGLPLDLGAYDPGIEDVAMPPESRFGILAADGTLVWRNVDPDSNIGRNVGATKTGQRLLATREGSVDEIGSDGIHRYFSVVPIPGADWYAFVGVPSSAIHATAVSRAVRDSLMGLSGIAIVALLALFLARRIERPMRTLAATAQAIKTGNVDARAAVAGPHEVADVAREFNAMVDAWSQSMAQLKASELRFRTVADYAGDWEYWEDPHGCIKYMSPSCETVTGFSRDDFISDPGLLSRIVHLADRPAMAAHRGEVQNNMAATRIDFRITRRDGDIRWIAHHCAAVLDADGKYAGRRVTNRDITAQKHFEARLQLAANVFTQAREGITITDANGTIVDVNNAFTRLTGYGREEAIGQNPRILKSGRQPPEYYAAMWQALAEEGHWSGEIWNRRKDGEVYVEILTISAVKDNAGATQNYVALFTDITPLKEHQRQLEHIAHYDALTCLPNRVLLADRLQQAMAQAQRRGNSLAVAYLDLDGFKTINDNHGHDIGDELLIALSQNMKTALREGDTLARIGGDEFVAVLVDLQRPEDCEPVLARLLQTAATPMGVRDLMLQVSSSIGVTLYPQDGASADQLMRHADQAMYQAKQSGKNRYHLFDVHHDAALKSQRENLAQIRRAIDQDEFVLYYQPKVNMKTGVVVGAEALIRWQHPARGLLLPAEFLPIIDEHPLSIDLDAWVIEAALAQMAAWHAAGHDIPVSVNIGARQLQQKDFVSNLTQMLAAYPMVQPGWLELEVLETNALEDIAQVSAVIDASRGIGVRFALDDFGTGYSSLTYLKRLPAEILKIDQSFVRDMLEDPEDLAIVEGVVGLAAAFRRQVIAEGVESANHGDLLLALGCELGQGYGIARPMPHGELPAWISSWKPHDSWLAWQNRQFNRNDLAVVFAEVEHRHWLRELEAFLAGERATPPPLDAEQCRFGQWLIAEGRTRYGTQGNFPAVDAVHKRVHALAKALAKVEGAASTDPRLEEIRALRDELIAGLREWRAAGSAAG